ncbi:hypothetical protein ACWD33_09790 [Streptomyces xiamenensis]
MGTSTVRATLAWLVMSLAWVAVVLTWGRLGHDPASWTAVCVGVAAVLMTLLVLVVPFATQAVQVHLRYSPRLALSAFDWVLTTYTVGFLASSLLPLLMAAAPSRRAALVSVALLGPVAFTLLPAVPFFSQRLRPAWLLWRYTRVAIRALERPPEKLRIGQRREERHLLDESATALYGLLAHGKDLTLDDRGAVVAQAIRLLRAAVDRDEPWSTSFVISYLGKDLVPLAQRHARTPLTSNVRRILCEVVTYVNRETGAPLISAILKGLTELGTEASDRERTELATAVIGVALEAVALASREVAPESLARLPARPSRSHDQPIALDRAFDFRGRISTYHVLDTAVAAVERLTGPPARPQADGPLARESIVLPVRGCQLLSELVVRLLEKNRWVEYELILAPLAAWARYGLGTGPDRSADLTERGEQRVPYAQELEATAAALVTVSTEAFEGGFDHVAREALEGLVTAAADAAQTDPTAFIIYARALDRAGMAIFRRSQPVLARDARLAELVKALQPANRRLLEQAKNANDKNRPSPALSSAVSLVLHWALRPTVEAIPGHEDQALAIARTATSVLGLDREEAAGRSAPDATFLGKVNLTIATGINHSRDSDPEFALLGAVFPSYPDKPERPVTLHGAATLWGLLMSETTADRWEQGHAWRICKRVKDSRPFPLGAGMSADATAFVERFRSWVKGPWCLSRAARPHPDVPDGYDLISFGTRMEPEEGAAHLVRLLRRQQEAREEAIERAQWAQHPRNALRDCGALWGNWPPPLGSPDDPVGSRWHSLKPDELPDRYTHHMAPARRKDRVYQARTAGRKRVVITEPDGGSRLLRGVSSDPQRTPLHYGGTGISILGNALVRDVLGPWQYCPSCHGASAQMLLPGYCHTCSGSGNHPGLGAAQQAVERSLPGSGHEWDITRSEFLDAIVTMTDDS